MDYLKHVITSDTNNNVYAKELASWCLNELDERNQTLINLHSQIDDLTVKHMNCALKNGWLVDYASRQKMTLMWTLLFAVGVGLLHFGSLLANKILPQARLSAREQSSNHKRKNPDWIVEAAPTKSAKPAYNRGHTVEYASSRSYSTLSMNKDSCTCVYNSRPFGTSQSRRRGSTLEFSDYE